MRHNWLSVVIGSFVILSAHSTAAAPLAVSTFDTNTQGWTIFGDADGPVFEAAAGNPAGDIIATDRVTGIVWFFNAPAAFLGNKSAASLQTLTFELSQSLTSNPFNDSDVVLIGSGLTLAFDTAANPAGFPTFTHYVVPLDATAGWHLNSLAGPLATQAQIDTALSSLTALRIRGEFRSGADQGRLDNVVLNGAASVAEPTVLTVFGMGIVGFGGLIWRRRRHL
jgi:laminin B (domain IV)